MIITLMMLSFKLFRIPKWSPVYIFCLFWWLQFSVCYFLFRETSWSIATAFYIMFCGIAAQIGFWVSNSKQGIEHGWILSNRNMSEDCIYNIKKARILIMIYISLGLVYAIISLRRYGFSINAFMNVDSLFSMNNEIATSRYTGSSSTGSMVLQLLLTFVYFAPLAGGYHHVFSFEKKDKILSILVFIPEMFVLFSANMKSGFIGCIVFWISGYLVAKFRMNAKICFSFKQIITVVLVIALVIMILLSTMVLRIGTINSNVIQIVINKFENYAFGHVAAVDDWLDSAFGHSDLLLGTQTFIGITRYIVHSSRVQGIYQEFYIGSELKTNIFSYFRGIFADFGSVGSVVFFLTFGFLCGGAINRVIVKKNKAYISELILVMEYAFSLYFIVSIFSYMSFVLTFVLFFIHSMLCQKTSISWNKNNIFLKNKSKKVRRIKIVCGNTKLF